MDLPFLNVPFVNEFQEYLSLKTNNLQFFDVQKKAIDPISSNNDNICVFAGTGSGKTLIFNMCILNYIRNSIMGQ